MAQIELARAVYQDFDRIIEHLIRQDVADRAQRIEEILTAITILEANPTVGRRAGAHYRELVIGEGSHGYLALYRYYEEIGLVFVDAIRSQREVGYKRP